MNLHLGLKLILSIFVVSVWTSMAVATDEVHQLVEVELPQNILAPYKERRADHGSYITIGYEELNLGNYISTIDSATYGDMFGNEALPLLRLQIDYKYNFELGSLALGAEFGTGSISDDRMGEDRTLSVHKYGIVVKYSADMLFDEPYVVPYGAVHFWKMDISESSPADSFAGSTDIGMNYTLGVLLQLNWIDPDSSRNATNNWGLENTFLDLYATQYAKSSSIDDPDTETDALLGGGLIMEF